MPSKKQIKSEPATLESTLRRIKSQLLTLGFIGVCVLILTPIYVAFRSSDPIKPALAAAQITETPTQRAILEDKLSAAYRKIDGIRELEVITVILRDDGGYIVYGEIAVTPAANTEATATLLRDTSYKVLVSARVEFSAILWDGERALDYTWSNITDSWTITDMTRFRGAVTLEPTADPTTDPTAAPDTPIQIRLLAAVNVRSGPGANYTLLGKIPRGTLINLSGMNIATTWYYFLYYDKPAWISADSSLSEFTIGHAGLLPIIDPDEPVATPQVMNPLAVQSSDNADIKSVKDMLAIAAGGRDIRNIMIVNNRPDGGKRVVLISYSTLLSDQTALIEELLDIYEGAALAIIKDKLDLDGVSLIIGVLDQPVASAAVDVEFLVAWQRGELSRDEFFTYLSVSTFDIEAKPNSTSVPSGSFTCPKNCTEARARGVSAQLAAACGLDRDGDGVACYGE